jgi:methylase of polypeptide subunit release factors
MGNGERVTSAARPPVMTGGDRMPIRIGSAEEFAAVRDFLRGVGLNESALLSLLKIDDLSQIPNADSASVDTGSASAALLAVVNLFVLGNLPSADDFRASCGEAAFAALTAVNLIRDARDFPPLEQLPAGTIVCPVWLYPVDGLFVVSDRNTDLKDNNASRLATEAVFPAHDFGTLQLLRLLPSAGSGDALDLCGGSGIGGLHLARSGMRTATADITARSAHFAAFNARLNGLQIEVVSGDLYDPVGDRRFDVICAHPPWVPSTGDAVVFRDGGETGETVVERVFCGIPHHLREGGTAIVVSLGRDGHDFHYENRVRRWLGEAGRDCDVILGVNKILSIDEMVASVYRLHLKEAEKAERMAARFRDLGTERFVYGAVFVRRTGAEVAEPPLRLTMSSLATAHDFERAFAWRQRRRRAGFVEWLAESRPYLCPQLEANVRYVVRDGTMIADSTTLSVKRPLCASVQPAVWVARLLERLKGNQTVAQTLEAARQSNQVPGDFALPAFVDLVGKMIERGLLEIDMPAC